MTTINTSNVTTSTTTSSSATNGITNSLGKEDFLKLLVAQLKNQDPMSPTDNTAFVAQLAQFSSLEQMSNMASSIEELTTSMRALSSQSLLTQGAALIGKEAFGIDSDGAELSGTITSVSLIDDSLIVTIGDTQIDLGNITKISQ